MTAYEMEKQNEEYSMILSSIDDSKKNMHVGLDVPMLLKSRVAQFPDKDFLIWEPFEGQPKHWTYREFYNQVEAFAAGLHRRHVAMGDKVLIHMDNSPEFLIAWFACARLGAVAVSTNTRCVARDISYFAEHAEVVCALTQPLYAQLISEAAPKIQFLAVTESNASEAQKIPLPQDSVPFNDIFEFSSNAPDRQATPMADLSIQFTSGTTSRPKAVLWTHANAVWGARMNAMHFGLGRDDVSLVFLPLYHTNAQSYSMLGTLHSCGTMVLQPRFSASRFWDVSVRNKCSWASMIPFCVKALLSQEMAKNHLYRLWVTAVKLTQVEQKFGVKTLGLWGMTETVTLGIVGDIYESGPDMNIGRVSPAYDIAIKNNNNEWIQPGETGRLFIRGTRGVTLFKEYYKNTEANNKSFDDDGWFDTGDLVAMDEEGNLFFRDRDKDMLKVGAENVAASEIEAVIMETGLVDECAVVGQKHYMLDEVPVAFIIPLAHNDENVITKVMEACRLNLPDFKVVRSVILVNELPRSTLEKIAKNELRAQLEEITE